MHQKRVTCELHDSYFPLDDDQTCHSKDDESAYSDGQLWGDIEWALNYYITEYTRSSISFETRLIGEKMR